MHSTQSKLKDDEMQINQILATKLHRAVDEILAQQSPAIKRPAPGGKCAAVWDQLDHMARQGKSTPTLDSIRKYGARQGWNENNTRIEFYRWKQATQQPVHE